MTGGVTIPADHQIGVAECECSACTVSPAAVPMRCPYCGRETLSDNPEDAFCAQCWLGRGRKVRFVRKESDR